MNDLDWQTTRARRIATVRRLLTERVQARGVVFVGKSIDEAAAQLYYDAGAPYGDGLLGALMWLDDQARPEDRAAAP